MASGSQAAVAGRAIARRSTMENEEFNRSLRRFLKEVGVSSQKEIERIKGVQSVERMRA